MTRLFLLSNSTMPGRAPLEHALPALDVFLGTKRTVHFAPFALNDHDAYTAKIQAAMQPLGVTVVGLHRHHDPRRLVLESDVLFIGGGNSFRLLKQLEKLKLLSTIRERVMGGRCLYIGASAGTNMACPTLRTTNDMPIVWPRSFKTLGLLPFQINPHYVDADPSSTHMGETRQTRIKEFLEENRVCVLGLREGSWLHQDGSTLTLGGQRPARLFSPTGEQTEFSAGADLSSLLHMKARFDRKP